MSLDLYIGNKNYSSWSLRPWLLLKHLGIPFTEHMVSVAGRDYNPALRPIAGNARVPCLHVDGFQIWESLAIAEYLAEQHPQLWPADTLARARARSISAEMHSGFVELRRAMPMNLKFKLKGKPATTAVQRDIDRIVEIWTEARTRFATPEGPWLFGAFSIADAMFAPIAWRFHTYNVPLPEVAAAYRDALLAHPAMQEWYAAALQERDPLLVVESGSFKGQPVFPFGHGVVFTNITRKQFDGTDLHEVFPPERCIFRDEMAESVDPDAFRERVWRMVSRRLGSGLSLPQIDRVRARLFPEIRVTQIALPFDESPEKTSPADDRQLEVMDMQQELLARSMGEGHRIVRGVAGSGKTLILAFRAEQIARAASHPVLILSYANGISGRLENAMQDRGVEDKVIVSTFHAWCWKMLRTYDIPHPNEQDIPDYSERLAANVQAVLDAAERGLIPGGQYDAVLIDEAHDFEPQWLALAAKMVNPDTKALMIVYDDAQAIYKGRKRPVWRQLGIEAAGRTTVLKVNYRNTAQILRFARKFAADVIGAPGVCAGDENAILMPEDGGRQGVEPVVRQCVSYDGEAHAIAEWLLGRKAAGYEWGQMAVLYPRHFIGERFEKILAKHNVPVDVAKDHGNRVDAEQNAVRFLSMHNAKGLEFPCVAIGGLGELKKIEDIEDDIRLTYVAITRATHEAFITYSNMSELVGRLVV